jgi:hypothetical protein
MKMSKRPLEKKYEYSATLNTVMMVEDALRESDESAMTIARLKKDLPRQVNHRTLMGILSYLEQSNKIAVGLRGITWIENPSPKLKKAIQKGLEI